MKNFFSFDILSAFIVIFALVYGYVKLVVFQYWRKKNIPYLEPTFPYGNLKRNMPLGQSVEECYKVGKKIKGWKYFGSFITLRPIFIPTDLELVKSILTKDFHKMNSRGIFSNEKKEPITGHLLALSGTKWKNLRAKVTPTFTSGKMKMMFQTLADCGVILEQTISELVTKKEPVDIKNVLGCFSTDIIGSCAFGLECNSMKEPNSPFRRNGKRIFERNTWEGFKFIFLTFFPKVGRALGMRLFPKDLNDFFVDLVVKTIEYREKNNITRKDFLQLLIDIKNNKDPDAHNLAKNSITLTTDEIVAQCFVFFGAGFETSSTTMTFTLFELAQRPEMQQNVRNEIRTILNKYEGKITYESLKEMKYMEQVINESLRMHPPIPILARICTEDYQIPGTDIILQKGTNVVIPVQGIHCDEEYYPNPEKFDPERFNEEQKQQRHPYAHIPFGEGPRICIGMRFGMMQTKVGLITVLKNYKVSLNEKTKLPLELNPNEFISSAKSGIWLNIEKI